MGVLSNPGHHNSIFCVFNSPNQSSVLLWRNLLQNHILQNKKHKVCSVVKSNLITNLDTFGVIFFNTFFISLVSVSVIVQPKCLFHTLKGMFHVLIVHRGDQGEKKPLQPRGCVTF